MNDSWVVRRAETRDAAACAAIYAPYVADTVVSFETEPPSPAEMAARIAEAAERHAWLVLEDSGRIVGYAYGTAHRSRAAYRWACDVSIYLEIGRRRTGAGRALYAALLPLLATRGFRRAYAGIALPNDASIGIHRAFGFIEIGTYHRVGWKHGAWHDVTWLELDLAPDADPTAAPAEIGRTSIS